MTEQQPQDATPQPNTIIDKPATVDVCRKDYERGAAERRSSEQRDARARRIR